MNMLQDVLLITLLWAISATPLVILIIRGSGNDYLSDEDIEKEIAEGIHNITGKKL